MKKWKLVIPIATVAAFLAWYAFRPERLVVNRRVDEAMPAAPSSSSPQPLVSGQFYSILHPTAGTGHLAAAPNDTSTFPDSPFYVHLPNDRSKSVNECIGLLSPPEC